MVAPRDEMKSEQGDDNDATCGRVGDLRIHSPHISTPPFQSSPSLFSLPLALLDITGNNNNQKPSASNITTLITAKGK